MAVTVYALCAITSLLCAALLLRAYRNTRVRLLLWSGLCFVGFFVNNVLLLLDTTLAADLSIARAMPALAGAGVLIYGLIWETRA